MSKIYPAHNHSIILWHHSQFLWQPWPTLKGSWLTWITNSVCMFKFPLASIHLFIFCLYHQQVCRKYDTQSMLVSLMLLTSSEINSYWLNQISCIDFLLGTLLESFFANATWLIGSHYKSLITGSFNITR